MLLWYRCLLTKLKQSSNSFFFLTKFYSSENSAHSLFSRLCLTQERTHVLNFQPESSAAKSNVYVYISTYMSTYALLSTWHFSQHHRLVGERLAEKVKTPTPPWILLYHCISWYFLYPCHVLATFIPLFFGLSHLLLLYSFCFHKYQVAWKVSAIQ